MTDSDRLLRRYEALLGAVPQTVWTLSADGVVTTLVGGEVQKKLWHPGEDGSWTEAVHPKDRDGLERKWLRATRERTPLDTIVRMRAEGDSARHRYVRIVATPVEDQAGEIEWVGSVADAEEHWRTRTREKLLARMAPVPAARDLSEAFMTTAAAVVPELADAVAIFLVPHEKETDFWSTASPPMDKVERVDLAPGLPTLSPLEPDFLLGPVAQRAMREQQAQLMVFPEGRPPEEGISPASARWLREAGATSVALVPVVVSGRTVALAATATCRGNPPCDEGDLALLQDVFQQMSGPLRRTMELQSARATALALQQSFLAAPPPVAGLVSTALYHPADSDAEVGGDWYDAVSLAPDTLALSIGDIAGHDVDAATTMGRVNSMLRALAYDSGPDTSPAGTLGRLDRVVQALDTPSMITAVHAILRRESEHFWRVTLSNAGHPPPLLIPAGQPARYLHGLATADPPLCVADAVPRSDLHTVLREGDALVLYTDGLVETPGTDIGHNLGRLRERTDELAGLGLPLAELVKGLLPPVQNRLDDIAVIALQVRGER
ncbi:PAS/PAC sensor protein [Streptomyces sp. GBA 94-10 4N24]|uniref:SpoIIE family protein phosphatase n=1 Tax=Streptomyces sp. GBA 94-10 4N24 TaxID=1218177 RepID=UPI0002EA8C7D|nr:SpoIIE family protein phosphatase [Streptomyces sp. GBA 94-10 4N24]ESP99200.1 PAS/PAC sensor protein [Streptomyces sp. GBA 94-10 4N24]UZN59708.1 PAS/PAC sensor protein [Streptomyces sp. GBA 94-10 4N24]